MKLFTTLITLTIMLMIVEQTYMMKVTRTLKDENIKEIEMVTIDKVDAMPKETSESTTFGIFGDTGQVRGYFKEYLMRELSVNSTLTTLREFEKDDLKFENTEKIFEALKSEKREDHKPKFDQVVILGDMLYTENKKGKVYLTSISGDLNNLSKTRKFIFKPNGEKFDETKDQIGKDGVQDVTQTFLNRVISSSKYFNKLIKNFIEITFFWIMQSGNHSYDVDEKLERLLIVNDDKTKIRMYKNSKVHISKHACFADLPFGDIVCLNKSYEDCLKGALMFSRYGRNKEETIKALLSIIESILTLKLCKLKWRIIRTHAAPFNTEIDAHYLFGEIKGKIQCKARKYFEGIGVDDKNFSDISDVLKILDKSQYDLTYDLLMSHSPEWKYKVESRLFECKIQEIKETETEKVEYHRYSVMELIDAARPHFYLASHLHASQVLFAPKIVKYNEPKRLVSPEVTEKYKGCNEINFINKYDMLHDDMKFEKFIQPCTDKSTIGTIEIKSDIPDYNIIFVIGNSGRFLDPFNSGSFSRSQIIFQRINGPGDKEIAFCQLKGGSGTKKRLPNSKARMNAPISETKMETLEKKVQEILDADSRTFYGYADLHTIDNNKVQIKYEELNPKNKKFTTVLDITLIKGDKSNPVYITSNNKADPVKLKPAENTNNK